MKRWWHWMACNTNERSWTPADTSKRRIWKWHQHLGHKSRKLHILHFQQITLQVFAGIYVVDLLLMYPNWKCAASPTYLFPFPLPNLHTWTIGWRPHQHRECVVWAGSRRAAVPSWRLTKSNHCKNCGCRCCHRYLAHQRTKKWHENGFQPNWQKQYLRLLWVVI